MTLARPFLGSGLSLPLRVDQTGDYVVSSESDQIKESLFDILGTRLGERRRLPTYGSKLHFLMFESLDDPDTQSLAQAYSFEATRLWEPRVVPTLAQIYRATLNGKEGFALVMNYVEIKTNVANNIVFPFNQG